MATLWSELISNDSPSPPKAPRWIQTIPRIRTQHKIVPEHTKNTQGGLGQWQLNKSYALFPPKIYKILLGKISNMNFGRKIDLSLLVLSLVAISDPGQNNNNDSFSGQG